MKPRLCTVCKVEIPRMGRRYLCNACHAAAQARYKLRRDVSGATAARWREARAWVRACGSLLWRTCSQCGQVKLLRDFSPHATGAMGVESRCRACRAVYRRAYHRRTREHALAAMREYRREHRNTAGLCECGNERAAGRRVCARCLDLEASQREPRGTAAVLAALRACGGEATMDELIDRVAANRDAIAKSLERLRRAGKVQTICMGIGAEYCLVEASR